MKDILLKYITNELCLDEHRIHIRSWSIEGSECTVSYYIDDSAETIDINVWDMLVFLNFRSV
jgi:hypothetical protein